jgi:hypothetical protein
VTTVVAPGLIGRCVTDINLICTLKRPEASVSGRFLHQRRVVTFVSATLNAGIQRVALYTTGEPETAEITPQIVSARFRCTIFCDRSTRGRQARRDTPVGGAVNGLAEKIEGRLASFILLEEFGMPRHERDGKGSVKFRVIEFEVQGGNESIQEGLRSIATAIARSRPVVPPVVVEPVKALPSTDANLDEQDASAELVQGSPVADGNAGRVRPARRAIRSPSILELDLLSGEVSLKDFCEQKSPDSDWNRYLVIAYWLKKYRDITAVTMDHIHTCYRHMGWHTPKNAAQPLRELKSKRDWLSKGASKGEYQINHVGENEVMKMGDGSRSSGT